jgi:hypothetical protein
MQKLQRVSNFSYLKQALGFKERVVVPARRRALLFKV